MGLICFVDCTQGS